MSFTSYDLGVVERAYQLARSGSCPTVTDIRKKLRAEHYLNVESHLAGKSITAALTKLCNGSTASIAAPLAFEERSAV